MTWVEFKNKRVYKSRSGILFVNCNRKLKLFIRANRGVDETRTFNFNQRGFEQARQWIEEL